jgi:hypothetical protein
VFRKVRSGVTRKPEICTRQALGIGVEDGPNHRRRCEIALRQLPRRRAFLRWRLSGSVRPYGDSRAFCAVARQDQEELPGALEGRSPFGRVVLSTCGAAERTDAVLISIERLQDLAPPISSCLRHA